MNVKQISQLDPNASYLIKCIKTIDALLSFSYTQIDIPAADNTPSSDGNDNRKTITVLMENEHSTKLLSYEYRTNFKDSPTKRLIALKNLHHTSPPGTGNPKLVTMLSAKSL